MSRKQTLLAWSKCLGFLVGMLMLIVAIVSRGSIHATAICGLGLVVLGSWFVWVQDWRWRRVHRTSNAKEE